MAVGFELPDVQRQIRSEAERFCRDKLAPLAPAMDETETWPDEVFPLLGQQGYLGEENHGVAVVMSGLDLERIFLAPAAVGMAERCLKLSLEQATTRQQFDRAVIDFQAVEFKLADMWIGIETARTYAYRVLGDV